MKSKPRKKSLRTKLKEAKIARTSAKSSLESSRGSAQLQILGAKMKLKEAKARQKGGRLPGPSPEVEAAGKSLEGTRKRAAGKDQEGLRLRGIIKDNRRIPVIKRHFKKE